MTEPLRFGIVGCGVIGPTHAEAITSLADAHLVAVADPIAGRADKLATKYGVTAYTNIQEMLDSERLDVVTICTPSGEHGKHARQAMHTGRHVIIEKPMEIARTAIDEILRTQQEMDVKLSVISQHRFDVATRQVHALVQEQAFGRLVLGNASIPWWRSQAYYNSGAWRGTWEFDGGGVLMNQSIHSIDLLQWLMGPVKSLYAYTDTLAHTMETEDVGVAVLRFTNGAVGTIAATTGAYPGITTRVEVFGDRGSACIENDQLGYLRLARDEQEAVNDYGANTQHAPEPKNTSSAAQNPAALSTNSHALQIADMIRAIREDGTPLVDGHAARQAVDIILSIYESVRTHREIILS